MTLGASVVLATIVAVAVALLLWLTRDGLGPESGAKLPMVAAVAALTGTWSGFWTLWIGASWLDWRLGTGHVITVGALLFIAFVLLLILSFLAAMPFFLAISIVWLRRIPFVWVLWVATGPALSVLWLFNRDSGQWPFPFVASATLLELSLYALLRIAGSMRHPKWRRMVSSGPTLKEEWRAAWTALREAAPTMLRWTAGLVFAGVVGFILFAPAFFMRGRTEDTEAYDRRQKARKAVCEDYPVAAWRVIPNDNETGTFLLEATVRVRKSGSLGLGMVFLRGASIVMRDRRDPRSDAEAPRDMVQVERRQYVILRRALERHTEGQVATQAEFGICTEPQADGICGWFTFSQPQRVSKFVAPERSCSLPVPTEVPSFVTLAKDGR